MNTAPSAQPATPPWMWVLVLVSSFAIAAVPLINLGAYAFDEFHQFLEPAWRMAGGPNSVVAWEWQPQFGLRNPVIPGLLAGLIGAGHAIGLSDPWWIRVVLGLPFVVLWTMVGIRLGHFQAPATYHPGRHALAVLVVFGMPAIALTAGRTLSETYASGCFLLAATYLPAHLPRTRARAWTLGLLAAAIGIARYGSIPFALALIPPAVLALGWKRSLEATIVGSVVILGMGLLDVWRWGDWFHSFWAYFRYNSSPQSGVDYGFDPVHVLIPALLGLPILSLVALRWWRDPLVWSTVGGLGLYLGLICTAYHKDTRFLIPAFAAAGLLAATAAARLPLRWGWAIGGASFLLTGVLTGGIYNRIEIPTWKVQAALTAARSRQPVHVEVESRLNTGPGAFWSGGAPIVIGPHKGSACSLDHPLPK